MPEQIIAEYHVATQRFGKTVDQIAGCDITVLITGETGVGKGVLARYIHDNSKRASQPFVTVNCGSLPSELISSELFGHKIGAFTGAVAKHRGMFEQADRGTIFLDEIGELPPTDQTQLLRVVQEKTIRPLGATGETKVDVRIICATNADIRPSSTQAFRSDLFYRISAMQLHLRPLWERTDEIPFFISHFLKLANARHGKNVQKIQDDAMEILKTCAWPGNIRQLGNVIESMVIICDKTEITQTDIPKDIRSKSGEIVPGSMNLKKAIRKLERELVTEALRQTSGNVTETAKLLDINREQVYPLMKKHGLDVSEYRQPAN